MRGKESCQRRMTSLSPRKSKWYLNYSNKVGNFNSINKTCMILTLITTIMKFHIDDYLLCK